jgi:hypothetical protein
MQARRGKTLLLARSNRNAWKDLAGRGARRQALSWHKISPLNDVSARPFHVRVIFTAS